MSDESMQLTETTLCLILGGNGGTHPHQMGQFRRVQKGEFCNFLDSPQLQYQLYALRVYFFAGVCKLNCCGVVDFCCGNVTFF